MMHEEIHLRNIMKTLQTSSTLTTPTDTQIDHTGNHLKPVTHCNGTPKDSQLDSTLQHKQLESHTQSARRNSHPLPETRSTIPPNLLRIRSVSWNESKPLLFMRTLSDVDEETESGISLAISDAFYMCWSIY